MQLTPIQVDQVLRENGLLIGIKNFEKLTDTFEDISYDSREAKANDIFVAKGSDFELYINQAIKKEIGAAVTLPTDVEIQIPQFIVNDIDKSLAVLSAAYFEYPNQELTIIGITGTKGKTSTAYMTYQLLREITNNKTALFSTIDRVTGPNASDIKKSELTTPESYQLFKDMRLAIENGMTHLVMEVSSQAYLRQRVYGIEFAIGTFLNISDDHIGENEHKDFQEYLDCKLELFENSKQVLINQNIKQFEQVINKAKENIEENDIYLFSQENSDINYQITTKDISGSQFKIESQKLKLKLDVELNLAGEFNIENATAAISIAQIVTGEVNQKNIEVLKRLEIPGRMLVINKKPIAIVDYAHNGASLESLLKFASQFNNQITLVIGATGDKGQNRRQGLAEAINQYKPKTILTADDPGFEDPKNIAEEIASYFEDVDYQIEIDRQKAIKKAVKMTNSDGVVIIAGKGDDHYQKIEGVDTDYPGDVFIVEKLLK